jgi:hypothetical protein
MVPADRASAVPVAPGDMKGSIVAVDAGHAARAIAGAATTRCASGPARIFAGKTVKRPFEPTGAALGAAIARVVFTPMTQVGRCKEASAGSCGRQAAAGDIAARRRAQWRPRDDVNQRKGSGPD